VAPFYEPYRGHQPGRELNRRANEYAVADLFVHSVMRGAVRATLAGFRDGEPLEEEKLRGRKIQAKQKELKESPPATIRSPDGAAPCAASSAIVRRPVAAAMQRRAPVTQLALRPARRSTAPDGADSRGSSTVSAKPVRVATVGAGGGRPKSYARDDEASSHYSPEMRVHPSTAETDAMLRQRDAAIAAAVEPPRALFAIAALWKRGGASLAPPAPSKLWPERVAGHARLCVCEDCCALGEAARRQVAAAVAGEACLWCGDTDCGGSCVSGAK
jgi:hypothetical protein